jgi:hypothetical protein
MRSRRSVLNALVAQRALAVVLRRETCAALHAEAKRLHAIEQVLLGIEQGASDRLTGHWSAPAGPGVVADQAGCVGAHAYRYAHLSIRLKGSVRAAAVAP